MPRLVPYAIVVGLFLVALMLIQFRDRSYLFDAARDASPPPPVSRVILPPTQDPQGQLLFVSGDRVAFRTEPDLQANVIERFNKGREVRQNEINGDWVFVRDTDTGRRGWISGRYLSPTKPTVTTVSN
ncbi:SH3 domain-containing protein [uncultured Roseibium sp.]|uniref:SH3 domain-containing protein n=1 Tax=uncultured Roseibium sp. TaxID=1936171 RepID=UPI00260531AF|nr:SH3 domain-containing protein [uncultured Roseibium sp.]